MLTRRKEVTLATKIPGRTADQARREIELSLKRLRTDHLDVLHIHMLKNLQDLAAIEAPGGVLEALHEARAQKITRAIGITCHADPAALRTALERHDFDCTQMALNAGLARMADAPGGMKATPMGAGSFERLALPVATRKHMGVIAMKVFGQEQLLGAAPVEKLLAYALSLPGQPGECRHAPPGAHRAQRQSRARVQAHVGPRAAAAGRLHRVRAEAGDAAVLQPARGRLIQPVNALTTNRMPIFAPMPFANSTGRQQAPVPEGPARIAQRFSVGDAAGCGSSPEGTAAGTGPVPEFDRPFGTWCPVAVSPALKRGAILTCPFGTGASRSLRKALLLSLIVLMFVQAQLPGAETRGQIFIGPGASAMEQYAARELQRYLYQVSGSLLTIETARRGAAPTGQVFLLGTRDSNPLIAELAEAGQLQVSTSDPGPQGYVLQKVGQAERLTCDTFVIAGSDEVGCLYGVYGLLEDYYGVGFYLGGDVLPDKKTPLRLPDVDERKKPAVRHPGPAAVDQLPAIRHFVFVAGLEVHPGPDGQDADELPAHPQLQRRGRAQRDVPQRRL